MSLRNIGALLMLGAVIWLVSAEKVFSSLLQLDPLSFGWVLKISAGIAGVGFLFILRGYDQDAQKPAQPTLIQRSIIASMLFRALGIIFMLVPAGIFLFLFFIENGTMALLFLGGWVILPALILFGFMLYRMGSKPN